MLLSFGPFDVCRSSFASKAWFAPLLLLSLLIGGGETVGRAAESDSPATTKLLPASNLDAFEVVSEKSSKVFRLDAKGVLEANGIETTYLSTKQEFKNFHLVVEYQWASSDADDNAGVVVNATTQPKTGQPASGFECDLPGPESEQAIGKFILVGTASQLRVDDANRRGGTVTRSLKNNPEKPAGEWNTLEVVADGGRFLVWDNGRSLIDARFPRPRVGRVLLQLTHGKIRFRRIEVTSFDALTEKAYELARTGKWKEAAAEFEAVRKTCPQVVSTIVGLHLATLHAAAGNKEAHETLCREFFEINAKPQLTGDSSRPAKAYLMADTAADRNLLTNSLTAAKRATDSGPRGGMAYWYFLTHGMAEYRSKDFAAANAWFTKTLRSKSPLQQAPAFAFSAMSLFQQGKVNQAKRRLASAATAFQQLPKPQTDEYRRQWNDILGAELAIREAEALIGKVPVATIPKPKTPAPTFGEWQTVPVAGLKGWSDAGQWWKEEDGVVAAESKGGADLPKIHYLVWDGAIRGNFEVSLEYRIVGTEMPQDAGFNFRVERPIPKDVANLPGYQAELDTGTQFADKVKAKRRQRFTALGKLFGHIHDGKRGRMFQRSKIVTITADGTEETKPLKPAFAAPRVYRNSPEWNTCRVQCVGDRVRLYLNDVLANEINDADAKKSSKGDTIALQYRPSGGYRYEIRKLKYRSVK